MKVSAAIFLFLVCLFAATAHAQTPSKKDGAALTALLKAFLDGTSDPEVHDRFWANELIYTRSTGVRTNKEEILKGLRSSPPPKATDPKTKYWAEEIVIHQYGKMAVVAFKLMIQTTRPDGTTGLTNNLNTGTFLKRNGRWQAVAWQSTVAAPKEDTAKPTKQ